MELARAGQRRLLLHFLALLPRGPRIELEIMLRIIKLKAIKLEMAEKMKRVPARIELNNTDRFSMPQTRSLAAPTAPTVPTATRVLPYGFPPPPILFPPVFEVPFFLGPQDKNSMATAT